MASVRSSSTATASWRREGRSDGSASNVGTPAESLMQTASLSATTTHVTQCKHEEHAVNKRISDQPGSTMKTQLQISGCRINHDQPVFATTASCVNR